MSKKTKIGELPFSGKAIKLPNPKGKLKIRIPTKKIRALRLPKRSRY